MTYIETFCGTTPPKTYNAEEWRADQLEKTMEVPRFAVTWERRTYRILTCNSAGH